MAAQIETKEQNVQGDFTTAEVTHLIESLVLERDCYMSNHLKMKLSGVEGAIREFHDNVTRPNLERVLNVVQEVGLPSPFTMPIEERENEVKAKLQGTNVEGTLTEGEAVQGVLIDAKSLINWYSMSYNLMTHQKVADVFRQNLQTVMEYKPRLEQALKNTREFVTPPQVKTVKLVGAHAKGVAANEAHGGRGGGNRRA